MDPFRINWQLLTLTVVAGQALLLALVLLFQDRGNRKANICLALVVLLLVWHHADFIANTSFWYQVFPYLFTPHYVSWFLFGPLIYLYIRFVLQPGYRPGRGFLWAFVPAMVSALNYSGLYALDKATKAEMIRDTVIRNAASAGQYFQPFLPSGWVFAAQLIFLAGFLWASFRLLRHPPGLTGQADGSSMHLRKRWLSYVLISFTATVVISNFYFRAIWLSALLPIGRSVYLYISPLTFLLVLLEIRAFLRPEVYAQGLAGKIAQKYGRSTLSEAEEKAIVRRLQTYMQKHKAYLDSDLRISRLSRRLGIPVNHLSQAINHQLQQNFFEFTNSYRVAEARRMLDNPGEQDLNLLNIAMESGFNNKTTFLNAFKKSFHISPSGYRKSLQRPNSATH